MTHGVGFGHPARRLAAQDPLEVIMNARRILPVLLALALAAPALGQDMPGAGRVASSSTSEGGWAINAAAGVLFPGSVYIEPYDWDTGTGFTVNAGLDYMVAPRLSLGLLAQYASTTLTEPDVGVTEAGIGVTLKAHFGDRNDFHFRGGISFMYQVDNVDEPGFDSAQGLGIGLIADLVKPLQPGTNLLFQLGFITQPTGGNADAEVTWAPLIYAAVGLELAK
jgi:hypothetical protein